MRPLALLASASVLAVLHLPSAHAQTEILYLPINARAVGMGHTGTADNTDPSSIYFNPANVVAPDRAYLVGSKQRFESEAYSLFRVDAGGSWKSNPESAWRWGANAAYSRFEANFFFADTDEELISLAFGAGTTRDRYEFRFGAGVKRLGTDVTEHLSVNPTTESIDGYAWDGGIAVAIHGDAAKWNVTPQFGVALIDAGPDLESADFDTSLPTRVDIGTSIRVASPLTTIASAEVPLFATIVNLEAESPDEGDLFWAMGTEISLAQILFLRGGLIIPSDEGDNVKSWGVGLGAPIDQFRIRFDYSEYVDDYVFKDEMSLLVAWLF